MQPCKKAFWAQTKNASRPLDMSRTSKERSILRSAGATACYTSDTHLGLPLR